MTLPVAAIQFDIAWNNPSENARRLMPLIQEASKKGAELIVLPELFSSGFSLCIGAEAKAAHTIGLDFLRQMAKEHGRWIAGSLPAPYQGSFDRPFNMLYLMSPTGKEFSYAKTHLFSFGDEEKVYRSGNDTLTVDINGTRVTFFVCYDLRFPHLFSKCAAQTDLFVLVANWPSKRSLHWKTLSQARAIENQAAFIAVNRIGVGGPNEYQGDSRGYSATGELIFDLGDSPGVGLMEVSPKEIAAYRGQFPVLKDRREDLGELA